ncbi:hypothetical protein INR49_015110 [Caranx melampygus]|nr:hypothetical protein INR49_015110 [Caranx melampygus]
MMRKRVSWLCKAALVLLQSEVQDTGEMHCVSPAVPHISSTTNQCLSTTANCNMSSGYLSKTTLGHSRWLFQEIDLIGNPRVFHIVQMMVSSWLFEKQSCPDPSQTK